MHVVATRSSTYYCCAKKWVKQGPQSAAESVASMLPFSQQADEPGKLLNISLLTDNIAIQSCS